MSIKSHFIPERHVSDLKFSRDRFDWEVKQTSRSSPVIKPKGERYDIAGTPYILPFLLAQGRGPYAKLGEEGAALAANLRALYPVTLGVFSLYAYDSSPVQGWDTIADNAILNGPHAVPP